jgi:arylsulfatase A-like enzyme
VTVGRSFAILTASLMLATLAGVMAPAQDGPPSGTRQLLVVLDGLRPDYVTPQVMPNLHALGRRGVIFRSHHSVFPTVTRVNASSISTGAYPAAHGLMGNSVFFPEVDPGRFLDTGERENLLKIDGATGGALLTAASLAQLLQTAGKKLLVVSSGSSGSATLLNHRVAGGAVLHTDFSLPEALHAEGIAKLGAVPPVGTPNEARNRRAVDMFLQIGLPRINPDVTLMWLSDPDETAHAHGVGHPVTIEALKRVDAELKRLQDGLQAAGLLDRYNIWVTSDHGFSTGTPGTNLATLLAPFAGKLADGGPRVVTGGGAIYVRGGNPDNVAGIVNALQRTSAVGAIFTAAAKTGSLDGRVPGTLSYAAIRWAHARSADVLFAPNWTDAKNPQGFAGTSAAGGVAGHGNSSPFDVHNVLMAAGPDLKQRVAAMTPSGNVDFAPTFLTLLGVDVPASMDGRVLHEAFRRGPAPGTLKVQPLRHRVRTADGAYALTGFFTTIESQGRTFRYFDYTKVER